MSIEALARECAEKNLRLTQALALFEAVYLAEALSKSSGNVTRAAKLAGIERETLARRMSRGRMGEHCE